MVRDAPPMIFADRDEAGRLLAAELARRLVAGPARPLVLALPRGGVPVAVRVAAALGGDLDIVLARKIGAPGRPDLAGPALIEVAAPTLLIVGGRDLPVLELNEQARNAMTVTAELLVVPGATHLFEEPGTLEIVAEEAATWFAAHLR